MSEKKTEPGSSGKSRLHALCPYFAMFPESFAQKQVKAFTKPGDYVLDPFSGRGTTLLQALLMKRNAVALDINPVAYCISAAKGNVPALTSVLSELQVLKNKHKEADRNLLRQERIDLPPFFRRAFHPTTLEEILFLRRALEWRRKPVHRFITSLALGSLHGEMDRSSSYFSNQMPRTISTKPAYSLRYWRRHRMWPRQRDVFAILKLRTEYRLNGDLPKLRGKVALADAREAASTFSSLRNKVRVVITSPPYLDVTNYEEDQWLRLWFLGYDPRPTYGMISRDDRYVAKEKYWDFLRQVWQGISPLLRSDAKLICRIGAKRISRNEITRGLKQSVVEVFPQAKLLSRPTVSELKNRQTDAFRPGSNGCLFEVDYIFKLGKAAPSSI